MFNNKIQLFTDNYQLKKDIMNWEMNPSKGGQKNEMTVKSNEYTNESRKE